MYKHIYRAGLATSRAWVVEAKYKCTEKVPKPNMKVPRKYPNVSVLSRYFHRGLKSKTSGNGFLACYFLGTSSVLSRYFLGTSSVLVR